MLGRPTLNELWAVISIYHLWMKFPTEHRTITIRADRMELRERYLNFFRKAEPRGVNMVLVDGLGNA